MGFWLYNALEKKCLLGMLTPCSQFSPSYSQTFPGDSLVERRAEPSLAGGVFHGGTDKLLRISVVNNLGKSRE